MSSLVIVPRPCFVEYGFYIGNHGGEMVMVGQDASDSTTESVLYVGAIQ